MKRVYTFLTVIAAVCVLTTSVLVGYLYMHSDRRGPEIIYGSDSIRYDGINTQLLLTDVTAIDERDGDVSDSLRVKAVLQTDDEIIITYLAKDGSNNITESSRHIKKGE